MKEIIYEKKLCTGCGACFQICPQCAVSMSANEEGFLYPYIDEALCNDCGMCKRTCPINRAAQQVTGAAAVEAAQQVTGAVAVEAVTAEEVTGAAAVEAVTAEDVTEAATVEAVTAEEVTEATVVEAVTAEEVTEATAVEAVTAEEVTGATVVEAVTVQQIAEPADAGNSAVTAEAEETAGTRFAAQHNVYACYSRDEAVRAKSSSGGMFTQLALSVLQENGVVFGAGFDNDFRVRHAYILNAQELDGLRRSKYVQSDTGNTFREVKTFLGEGRRVLYCGTPCQIAGLKAFLNRDDPKLLTCDLACHGVPSPKVWDMYLNYIRDRYKNKISDVSFRDKSTGWSDSSMRIDFEDGRRYMDRVKKETFFIGFGKSVFNRKSCFDCKFRIDQTKADITLADFWGIDRYEEKEYSDNRGVSLIITHTAAGEEALSHIEGSISIKKRSLDEAVTYNPRLVNSVKEPTGRSSFFNDLKAGHSFDRLRSKYMDNKGLRYRVKCLLKKALGRG